MMVISPAPRSEVGGSPVPSANTNELKSSGLRARPDTTYRFALRLMTSSQLCRALHTLLLRLSRRERERAFLDGWRWGAIAFGSVAPLFDCPLLSESHGQCGQSGKAAQLH